MKTTFSNVILSLVLIFAASENESALAAPSTDRVTPGEFVVEHPTLMNLGFEWHIDGDANRNAQVAVSFRKQGETAWRTGMPLIRIQNERKPGCRC